MRYKLFLVLPCLFLFALTSALVHLDFSAPVSGSSSESSLKLDVCSAKLIQKTQLSPSPVENFCSFSVLPKTAPLSAQEVISFDNVFPDVFGKPPKA